MAGNAAATPQPKLTPQGTIDVPGRTQTNFAHTPTGTYHGTANKSEARPGLSIIKLYIVDYAFKYGTKADRAKATQMTRYSGDNITSELYGRYPDSIDATVREYGLSSIHGANHWSNSTAPSVDAMRFPEVKKRKNPSDPVLVAMNTVSPVVADGYRQDYGTAMLPGVIGTKWGQSDDRRSIYVSASIGSGFSVITNTYGTKEAHTSDVQNAFNGTPGIPSLPGLPSSPSPSNIPNLPESPNLGELLNLPETPQLPQTPGPPNFTGHVPSQP